MSQAKEHVLLTRLGGDTMVDADYMADISN
jgi:hypothetical protein